MGRKITYGIRWFFYLLTLAMLPAITGMAQLSIGPGGYITVKDGGSLMVGTDLHIKSIAGASGYLVDQTPSGSVTITGDISVERYLTPDVWHNVASPVSNESTTCYIGTDLVFYYLESIVLNDWNFGWVWYPSGPLEVFKGYDVLFFTNPVTVNYQATGTETINTGSYTIPVSITTGDPPEIPAHIGWNLVGNPYPSPVNWLASGWNKASINDAKYIWDGANNIYTIFLGGSAPIGLNGGTQFIPSNQGFWVQALTSGNFGVANSVRVGDISGTPDFYKYDEPVYPLVNLITSGNGRSDEMIVRFLEGTTDGFDANFDASKLFSPGVEVPQINLFVNNQALAVNTLPVVTDNMEFLVDFRCQTAGEYFISLGKRTYMDDTVKIYLKDLFERKCIDLSKDIFYSFSHSPQNDPHRFRMYLNPSADIINNITTENYFTTFCDGRVITIRKNTSRNIEGNINVINIFGQLLKRYPLENTTITKLIPEVPSGTYIVCIQTQEFTFNTKVTIINNY